MTTLLPAEDLFPSEVLFPGSPIPVTGGGFYSLIECSVGDLVLTAADGQFVKWIASTLTGWWGSPASSMQTTPRTRAAGSWPGPREMREKPIGITGTAIAPTLTALRDAQDRLNAAASIDATLFTVSEGGLTRSCIVYRQDEVLWSRINDRTATWSAQLLATDPRKFGAPASGSTALPSSSGGLSIPFTIPFSIDSAVVSGNVFLSNPGNAVGPVVLRIDGPVVGPQVTHVGTGRSLTFGSSLTIGAGEWLEVNMEAQTALANGQSSRNSYINSRQWFGLDPGDNVFAFSAVSGSGLLTVTGTPAWQ